MDISPAILTSPRLISSKEVCRRTSLSRASLYRLIAQNAFPKSVALHGARKAWVEPEIDAWIRARIAARNGEAA
jgi:prophage regulatory protein